MAIEKKAVQKQEAMEVAAVERTRSGKVFYPPVDIYERNEEIVLLADMPGVDPKTIDIKVEKNILSIQGQVYEQLPADYELFYREYDNGDYQRSFTLNDTIDQNKIEAKYENGILKLRLPKAEKVKPKKIEVQFKS
jgi:HSP20 family protein